MPKSRAIRESNFKIKKPENAVFRQYQKKKLFNIYLRTIKKNQVTVLLLEVTLK